MLDIAIDMKQPKKEFTIVFIGGSHDGELRAVNRLPPFVDMWEKTEEKALGMGSPQDTIKKEHYKRHNLELEEYQANNEGVAILYIRDGLSTIEACNLILTRYVQGAKNGTD